MKKRFISILLGIGLFLGIISVNIPSVMAESQTNSTMPAIVTTSADTYNTTEAYINIDYSKLSAIRVNIEGKQLIFDINPQVVDGRTLVPMRAIFEAMGLEINWDDENKIAQGTRDENSIVFTIDSNVALVNNEEKSLDIPADIINGRTMIPLRFLSENMDYNVVWIGESNLILISKSDILEWRYDGFESFEPYREYEAKYINGLKTTETRYNAKTRPPVAVDIPGNISTEDQINNPNVKFNLKYKSYQRTFTYFNVKSSIASIRKSPDPAAQVLVNTNTNDKLDYVKTISDGGTWYLATFYSNGKNITGYVNDSAVTKRVFQLEKMQSNVMKAASEWQKGSISYINNYLNRKGEAPLYNGGSFDKDGNRRSQSAPGYYDINNKDEFIYITDGTLVRVLSRGQDYTKVEILKDGRTFYVPNKYIPEPNTKSLLDKVVVIDRTNQNEAVFEKINDEWKVISYTLATTGGDSKYQQPTPLGYFYGIEKKERFYYYKDGTTKIQGYAPYAIRFSGSKYVHGVPVNWKFDAQGNQIDPGMQEYSKTIGGSTQMSHGCVRNYTSHAKFLYDWYTKGDTAVLVIE